jgi:hypothetical protein
MYSRNNRGSPSDPTEINAAGIRKVANVISASNTTTSANWNGRRDRCGS